jgi:hypothetical protein
LEMSFSLSSLFGGISGNVSQIVADATKPTSGSASNSANVITDVSHLVDNALTSVGLGAVIVNTATAPISGAAQIVADAHNGAAQVVSDVSHLVGNTLSPLAWGQPWSIRPLLQSAVLPRSSRMPTTVRRKSSRMCRIW